MDLLPSGMVITPYKVPAPPTQPSVPTPPPRLHPPLRPPDQKLPNTLLAAYVSPPPATVLTPFKRAQVGDATHSHVVLFMHYDLKSAHASPAALEHILSENLIERYCFKHLAEFRKHCMQMHQQGGGASEESQKDVAHALLGLSAE